MKNNFIAKIIGASLAIAMMIGAVSILNTDNKKAEPMYAAAASTSSSAPTNATWSYTLNATDFPGISSGADSGFTKNLNNVSFTFSGDSHSTTQTYRGFDTGNSARGVQFGKGTSGWGATTDMTLTAAVSSFGNSIRITKTAIGLSCANSGGYNGTLPNGDTTNGSATSVTFYTSSTMNVTSGDITFTFKSTKNNKAMYVKAIYVWYEANSAPKTVQANSITVKTGSTTISDDTFEPSAPYCIGDTLDLTSSVVNYQQGDTYRDGDGVINWESDDTNVATVSNGIVTFVSAGETIITATAEDKGAGNATVSTSFILDISNAGPARGTENNPYTVEEARAAINAGSGTTDVYVSGIVSKIVTPYNEQTGYITYSISSNGTTSADQLKVYNGKSFNGANFTSENDVKVAAVVTVFGTLSKYNNASQVNQGNRLVSYTAPYTVDFDTDGGTEIDSQIVLDGQKAQRPAIDPTKESDEYYNYVFGGWYANPECTGNEYDFDTPVTSDLTIYAKWNATAKPVNENVEKLNTQTELSYRYTRDGEVAYDRLDRAYTGIEAGEKNYASWTGATTASGAIYAGQSAADHGSIQLRSSNSNSGIVTTASGGNAKKITVVWNENTASERTVDVYGKNATYTAPTDLYNANNQGTKIGSIVCGTSDSLTITGDYEYIGIRSNSGALYLDSITIQWGSATFEYSDISMRFGGRITKDLWNRLDTENHLIEGFGVMIASTNVIHAPDTIKSKAGEAVLASANNDYANTLVNFYMPKASMATPTADGDDYFWNLFFRVDYNEIAINEHYAAAAYIKVDGEYVFMKEVKYSVVDLANDYLTNRGCDYNEVDGSLFNLASLSPAE